MTGSQSHLHEQISSYSHASCPADVRQPLPLKQQVTVWGLGVPILTWSQNLSFSFRSQKLQSDALQESRPLDLRSEFGPAIKPSPPPTAGGMLLLT